MICDVTLLFYRLILVALFLRNPLFQRKLRKEDSKARTPLNPTNKSRITKGVDTQQYPLANLHIILFPIREIPFPLSISAQV